MPNHVKSELRIEADTKERVEEVMRFIDGGDTGDKFDPHLYIDFRKIIPMPATLNIGDGSRLTDGMKFLEQPSEARKNRGLNPEYVRKCVRLAKIAKYNKSKYGFSTWYDWRNYFWGTKWNAYESDLLDEGFITFNTAWNAPKPIIEKLSELFPDVCFTLHYADEDVGYNCGYRIYKGGELKESEEFEDHDEAIRFACEILGYDPDEFMEE